MEQFDPRIVLGQTQLPTPVWAQEIVDKVAAENDIKSPSLTFYRGCPDVMAGGWYHSKNHEIVVVTAFDIMSDMLTVVHELCHAIVDKNHTPAMYEKMLELVEQFDLDIGLAIDQELNYQPIPFSLAYRRYTSEKS